MGQSPHLSRPGGRVQAALPADGGRPQPGGGSVGREQGVLDVGGAG
jgi:hypothetical protein